MRKTALAVAAMAALGLGASLAPVAQASSGLHVTATPLKPANGHPVTAHITGGPPHSKDYLCIFSMYKKGVKATAGLADTPSFTKVTLNKYGAATCHMIFLKFKVSQKFHGKPLVCPPTRAEKAAGWKCGVAAANFVTRKQFTFALFKF